MASFPGRLQRQRRPLGRSRVASFWSVVHAAPVVYALFGHKALGGEEMPSINAAINGDQAHYHLRAGKHKLMLEDWQHYWNYANRVFARRAN